MKFLKKIVIILISIIFFGNSMPQKVFAQEEIALNFFYENNILLKEISSESYATRYDCLYMLCKIQFHDDEFEKAFETETFYDVPKDDIRNALVACGEALNLFHGKINSDGQYYADLGSFVSLKETLIMITRFIGGVDSIYLSGQYAENDDLLILFSENKLLLNLNDETTLNGINTENIERKISYKELCVLIYRMMHAPYIHDTYGGIKIKYLIDEYIN